jgi:hypothetical protein
MLCNKSQNSLKHDKTGLLAVQLSRRREEKRREEKRREEKRREEKRREEKRSHLKVDFWGQPTAISSLTRRKRVG